MAYQDIIPFLIVGGFLGAIVYSTVKSRQSFTDEQLSMDKLYENNSVPSIGLIKSELETLLPVSALDSKDMKRCISLLKDVADLHTPEAEQLNQRIGSTIRTLKRAIDAKDSEQISYTCQYLEVLLEERSSMK